LNLISKRDLKRKEKRVEEKERNPIEIMKKKKNKKELKLIKKK